MSEDEEIKLPAPQPPGAAILAIGLVFLAGLIIGFVLGRTL